MSEWPWLLDASVIADPPCARNGIGRPGGRRGRQPLREGRGQTEPQRQIREVEVDDLGDLAALDPQRLQRREPESRRPGARR
jgi:hypothetical protein